MNPAGGLRAIDHSDLDMLLEWRNSLQVRRFMYTSNLIEKDEHLRWYETIRNDESRHPLVFMLDGKPSGFVNIGPVKVGGIADWGFYTAPDAPKGTGHTMGIRAMEYAFNVLALHRVCGEALDYNEASRRFHLRLGFRQEGRLMEHYFDGSRYHDVIRFGLIVTEWKRLVREQEHESSPRNAY